MRDTEEEILSTHYIIVVYSMISQCLLNMQLYKDWHFMQWLFGRQFSDTKLQVWPAAIVLCRISETDLYTEKEDSYWGFGGPLCLNMRLSYEILQEHAVY